MLKISDYGEQIDILEYFSCIADFDRKVGYYKWLSSVLPSCYHDLTIADFISLDRKKLKKAIGKRFCRVKKYRRLGKLALSSIYSVESMESRFDNQFKILENVNLGTGAFADCVLEYMSRGDKFFDAGVALFHDDDDVQKAAKQYRNNRH